MDNCPVQGSTVELAPLVLGSAGAGVKRQLLQNRSLNRLNDSSNRLSVTVAQVEHPTLLIGSALNTQSTSPVNEENDVVELIHRLKEDPYGFKHVADDGIARSYNRDGVVVDYVRLNEKQMMEVARWHPEDEGYLTSHWKSVNGLEVPESQVWSPPHHFRPLVLRQPDLYEKMQQSAREPNLMERRYLHCSNLVCRSTAECKIGDCVSCIIFGPKPKGKCDGPF
ncbi:hypothetical protein EMCG_08515 [[Emmonsia] crescens]|uniref:Uncharacterized protein n=1 Tax=[Emmonsia] crescens TaxID=73230 RepID=A0A0G2J491_9EURO|nr:hypothetical protein EMCG_08515 [Emmonsia crescens UAMH 3008]